MFNSLKKKYIKNNYIPIYFLPIVITIPIVCSLIMIYFTDLRFFTIGDFLRQSYVYLEYFRDNFNKTHDLFPMINLNSGMGQNFATLFYYNFHSPMTFLYILGNFENQLVFRVFYAGLLISAQFWIAYEILKNQTTNIYILLLGIFGLGSPLIFFHWLSYHDMFTQSFIPFLLLLLGIKYLLERNKGLLISFAVALILIINFTFIVQYFVYALLYVIYHVLKYELTLKEVMTKAVRFILYTLLGCGLATIFLFPQLELSIGNRSEYFSLNFEFFSFETMYNMFYMGIYLLIPILLFPLIKGKHNIIVLVLIIIVMFFQPITSFMQLFKGENLKVYYGLVSIQSILTVNMLTEGLRTLKRNQLMILISSAILFVINIPLSIFMYVISIFAKKETISKSISNLLIFCILTIPVLFLIYLIILTPNEYLYKYSLAMCIMIIVSLFVRRFRSIIIFSLFFVLLLCTFISVPPTRDINDINITTNPDTLTSIYDNKRQYNWLESFTTAYDIDINRSTTNSYASLSNSSYLNHFNNTIRYNIYSGATFNTANSSTFMFNNQYSVNDILNLNTKPVIYTTTDVYSKSDFQELDRKERLYYENMGTAVEDVGKTYPRTYDDNLIYQNKSENVITFFTNLATSSDISYDGDFIEYNFEIQNEYGTGDFVVSGELDNEMSNLDTYEQSINNNVDKLQFEDTVYENKSFELNNSGVLKENESIYITIRINKNNDANQKIIFSDFEIHFISAEHLKQIEESYTEVNDFEVLLNRGYNFTTSCKTECYVATTNVYDEGYTVTSNGEEIETIKINTDFLGFKVSPGNNDIQIRYAIPNIKLYTIISMISLFVMICIFIYQYVNKLKHKL